MSNLPRPAFPRPDWRLELQLRELAERRAREAAVAVTEEIPSDRPPPRREAIEIGAPAPPTWQLEQLRADLARDRGGRRS